MKKNFIYNAIYQILVLILPLITMPYISRKLGADGVGIYSYTYSIVYYFMICAMLGLNNYGNRTIAKARDNKEKLSKEFWGIYIMQLVTSILMTTFYIGYVFIFDNKYKTIAIIQTLYMLSTMLDINWFFFGIEKFKLTITRNMLVKILSLILIFLFVKTENDVWIYTLILAGSTLLSNALLFPFLKRYINKTKLTVKDVTKHIKPNLMMFLPVIAVSIYNTMDKIMLGAMSNVTEVGYYENASKIVSVPTMIIVALGTVMLPRASNMISNNQEEKVKELLKKTVPFAMFLALPMAFGVFAIGKDFSILFFGEGFEKTGHLIRLLSINVIFLSWGNVIRTEYLLPKEKDGIYITSAFLGAAINFIMNCIFIPKYSSIGACIGTITAEFLVAFYQTYMLRKDLNIGEYMKDSIPFLIKTLSMFAGVIIVGKIVDTRFAKICMQIIVGGGIYVILNYNYISKNLKIKDTLKKYLKNKAKKSEA